jgi:hypothetical protein
MTENSQSTFLELSQSHPVHIQYISGHLSSKEKLRNRMNDNNQKKLNAEGFELGTS